MRKSIERQESIHGFLKRAFAGSLHAKRILSLANGTLGVLTGASLAVSVIGHALAQARGLADRHAIKQVDRLLSNAGVVVWDLFAPWVREVVGRREACRGRNRSSPSPRRSVRETAESNISSNRIWPDGRAGGSSSLATFSIRSGGANSTRPFPNCRRTRGSPIVHPRKASTSRASIASASRSRRGGSP